ncbi:DEAD/DEAH box helicase, partial [Klebsiella pneumoniae]
YREFCQSFPFETTPDQEQAINAVLSDMCQPVAMDRLVCGDVGFGKTEVAMRAAFLAVHNHKQVAVLVPTTLLAQQHYDNFRDRFANWPVRIEVLSRFR